MYAEIAANHFHVDRLGLGALNCATNDVKSLVEKSSMGGKLL